eukprot:TRINITY_DN2457_c0_g2_i2.p1 TRINITY_DN2457_c0_g2~~TRINITY_DN2457_c0_g2_i2.p1  ORF type:complete len:463 (-),score=123.38 TRINITY_DN2457_c0_g2_i2:110-1498(-)
MEKKYNEESHDRHRDGKGKGRGDRRGGRPDEKPEVKISKTLSYLLRHGALENGLSLRKDGYVPVDEILALKKLKSLGCGLAELKEVVATNEKKRFELTNEEGKLYIRATQGHTIKTIEDDLLLKEITNPEDIPLVVHGTFYSFWEPIRAEGLKTMSRNHIHFAKGYPGDKGVISGMRNTTNLYIEVDVEKAMKDGIRFYRSTNDVILSSGVNRVIPPKYFKLVRHRDKVIFQDGIDVKAEGMEIEHKVKKHDFDLLLILDFEAQCSNDPNFKLTCQEIIEFPVVVVDVETATITKTFHTYIKPEVHPVLTQFCKELTGITQDQVDAGISIKEALNQLEGFLVKEGIIDKRFTFVTCGDWDLRTCLKGEATYKKLFVPEYLQRWINIKQIFASAMNTAPPKGLWLMVDQLGMSFEGRQHSGIDDSKNIAKVVIKLLQKGVAFTKEHENSSFYQSGIEEEEHKS